MFTKSFLLKYFSRDIFLTISALFLDNLILKITKNVSVF